MRHPHASWFDPDKIIKDILWRDMAFASGFAKGKLLDIGCGNKPYQSLFIHHIRQYIGLDKYAPHADIKEDINSANIALQSFDTILSTQVLEHVPDPNLFLQKISKLLKKNGIVIITAPLVAALHEEPNDYYRFTKYALQNLFTKNGLQILILKEEGDWISSTTTMSAFYLESTCNRYLLRYPKKIIIAGLMLFGTLLSLLPARFTKQKQYPMNYLVIAKKK